MIKAQGGFEQSPGAHLTAQALTAVLAREGFIGILNTAHLSFSFSHACTIHSQTTRITQTHVHACVHTQISADSPRIHGHLPTHRFPGALSFLSIHLLPFRWNGVQSQGTGCLWSPASQHNLTSQSSDLARTLLSSQANMFM